MGMDELAFRLACAYGLADTEPNRAWPTLPLYCEDTGTVEHPAPLSGAQLKAIELLWAQGLKGKEIAARLGISIHRVYKVIEGDRERYPIRRAPYRRRGQQCREQGAS